jgi:hypothetical protein
LARYWHVRHARVVVGAVVLLYVTMLCAFRPVNANPSRVIVPFENLSARKIKRFTYNTP